MQHLNMYTVDIIVITIVVADIIVILHYTKIMSSKFNIVIKICIIYIKASISLVRIRFNIPTHILYLS